MKPISLSLFIGYGHGPRGWDHPRMRDHYDWRQPELYQDLAQVCERGIFEMFIFADVLAIPTSYLNSPDVAIKFGLEGICHDPVPLVAMIAAKTTHIGVAATLSTTYYPPFMLARLLTSLDHLTRGRIGWNVVTSSNQASAKNFGQNRLPLHDERYDIADEYMELCGQLWESWAKDAVLEPPGDVIFADPSRVHPIHFEGKHFRCEGPLNAVPSPQGRPVIIQAGASDRGRDFAARHADVVICSKNTIEDMKAFHDDVKQRAVKHGRKEEECQIIFTFNAMMIGATEEIVRKKQSDLELISNSLLEAGLVKISRTVGHDVSVYPLDEPLPAFDETDLQTGRSLLLKYYSMGRTPTLRQVAANEVIKENFPVRGTYEQVAERLIRVMEQVGGDGYAVRANYLSDSLAGYVVEFVDHVVPILQREGYARTSYPPGTLRERLKAGRS